MSGSKTKPANSSSEEEEESLSAPDIKTSSSDEESDSESDPKKLPQPDPTIKPNTTSMAESESESESESEYESASKSENKQVSSSSDKADSEPNPKNPPVPDPKAKASSSKTQVSEPEPTRKATSSKGKNAKEDKAAGKRPMTVIDDGGKEKRVKKTKKTVGAPNAEEGPEKSQSQSQLFQRLWSKENEVELIQGMIEFVKQESLNPLTEPELLHEFVKPSLHVTVTVGQLKAKSKRLYQKYRTNLAKFNLHGKVRSLTNPHEKKMFHFSKALWGNQTNTTNVAVTKKRNVKPVTSQTVRVGSEVAFVNELTEEELMNLSLEKLSEADNVAMDNKWDKLRKQQLKVFIKKGALMKEHGELLLKAYGAAN